MKSSVIAALFVFSLTALAQQPGTKRWTFTTGGKVTSSPAIGDDGTVYVGSQDKKLYAVSPSGSKVWEFATKGSIAIAPAIGPDGTIYIASDGNTLYAVAPDGKQRWQFSTGQPLVEPPAIGGDGTIYFSSPNGNLYAVNANGSEKWRINTGGSVPAPSIGSDGTIYVGSKVYLGSTSYSLYALNPDGSTKWRYKTVGQFGVPYAPEAPCVIDTDGTAYVMAGDFLTALRPDGTKKFDGVSFHGKFAIGPGGILYGRAQQNGFIQAVSADGSAKWYTSLPPSQFVINPTTHTALTEDGTMYLGADNGILYALDARDGSLKWGFETGSPIRSSPAVSDTGVVYFGADDGKLYAVNGSAGLAKSAWPMYRRDAKHTGAVSSPILSQTELALAMYPGLTIKGNVGASYRIEFSTNVSDPKQWQFLATVTLDRAPFFFVDMNAANATRRFYRAVLLP